MQIIPVIDLKGGQAVHASGGDRAGYKPISTPLCSTSDPLAVVRAYLALYPFRQLYLADLDAIAGEGDNDAAASAIEAAHPEVTLWIDRGLSDLDTCRDWLARHRRMLILGSESQRDAGTVTALARGKEKASVALSLDFRGARFLGPPALETVTALWPETLVVMTLAKVGSDAGPDIERLTGIRARAGRRRVFAAGGVRHADDLARLKAAGIAGALVASALHQGRLDREALATIENG